MKKTNYYYIDLMRFVCSILIVVSHCLPVFNNDYLDLYYGQWFFRFCVPFFFLTLGFFMKDNIKTLKRLLILYLFCTIIYLPIIIIGNNVVGVIYNVIFGYGPLWYLSGSIAAVFIIELHVRIKKMSNFSFLLLMWVGYFTATIFADYLISDNVIVTNILKYIGTTRNGLFFALPFIYTGHCIKCIEERIININKNIFHTLIPLFFMFSFFESKYLLNISKSLKLDMTIGLVPLSISIFLMLIIYQRNTYNDDFNIIIDKHSNVLRELSVLVYEFHCLFQVILNIVIRNNFTRI